MSTDRKTTVVAVLGTGLIGAPVARNLHNQGFTVHAWNRTAAKAQALVADGVQAFDTPADAVHGVDIIVAASPMHTGCGSKLPDAWPHRPPAVDVR